MTTPCSTQPLPPKRPTILVVEDEALLRELIAVHLEKAGYEVVAVADGLAALRRIKEGHIDLVVTDIFMPGADGMEVVTQLRQLAPQIPVIAISGGFSALESTMLKMVRLLGARRTVAKPFAMRVLVEAVREVLAEPGAAQPGAAPAPETPPSE